MTKLCENCAYYKGHDGDMCYRPLSDARSPVDGRLADTLGRGCWGERKNDRTIFGRERCGPSARFFAAKAVEARSAETPKSGSARRAKARSRSDLPNLGEEDL